MDLGLSPSPYLLDQLEGTDDPGRWLAVARERREAGDLDAAHAVLSAAAQRFADIAGVHHDRARLAEARGDWSAAEQSWRAFIAVAPRPWWAYTALANALREQGRMTEAESLLILEAKNQPSEPALLIEHAKLAERSGEWAQALPRWEATRSRFPEVLEGYNGQARALRELGRPHDAHALLLQALDRFPNSAAIYHDLGRLAESTRDWAAAERWWRGFLAIDARPWWAHTAVANALREQGQPAAGEAFLAAVLERPGQDPPIFVEHARFAERERDWPEAERRWLAVIERFPTLWDGYAGRAGALRSLGRLTDAQACLELAIERLPASVPLWHQLARLHEAMRDWPDAERCWRKSVDLDDRIWWAHAGIAHALREQGDLAQAEAVLSPLAVRFPNEPAVVHELARLADATGAQAKALDYWQSALTRFPNDWPTHLGTATALVRAGRRGEARALLRTGQERFPQVAAFFAEEARLADAERDWSRSEALWREASVRFPNDLGIRIGRINARRESGDLDAATGILADAFTAFPNQPELSHQQAFLCEANEDWEKSSNAWLQAIVLEPTNEFAYVRGSYALFRAGKAVEASSLLERGCERLGNRPALLRERGMLAARQFNWKEAVQHYRRYNALYPDDVDALCLLAEALGQTGNLREGEDILRCAIERKPDQVRFYIDYARIAVRSAKEGGREFVARAEAATRHFPLSVEASLLHVDSLSWCGDVAAAESVLRTALEKWPNNIILSKRLAEMLTRQAKWNDAIAIYTNVFGDELPHQDLLLGYIDALVGGHRFDQADAMATEAIKRFPTDGRFYLAHLDMAIANGKLDDAATLWKRAALRFSGSTNMARLLFDRRSQLVGLGVILEESRSGTSSAQPSLYTDELKIEDIVTQFESLGGYGIGCEFGQFQRIHGAEPLGLLRWTEILPDQLADALESRFAGVGLAEQTLLVAGKTADSEYTAADRRFGMRMHTFVPTHSVPYEKMFVQMCRRMQFLAKKLLDDLRAGEKIFVYKNAVQNMTDKEIERLHKAIRSYGNTNLLCVRRADADHPFPSLLCPAPGLMIGYLDRFERLEDGSTGSVPAQSWETVTLAAYRATKQIQGSPNIDPD